MSSVNIYFTLSNTQGIFFSSFIYYLNHMIQDSISKTLPQVYVNTIYFTAM